MKKKSIALILAMSLMLGMVSCIVPINSLAATSDAGEIIVADSAPLRLYYDEEASHGINTEYETLDTALDTNFSEIAKNVLDDWERWSIPLGNGYFGANIFGRTGTERIQLTEKTLANPYRVVDDSKLPTDGLNNFSETYIDFGHTGNITNYSRELDLRTAISTVKYTYSGVNYSREYFTSYPDNAMVIRLGADTAGQLGFVLRPTIPYEQEYMTNPSDRGGKSGAVTSSVSDGVGTVVLSGKMEYFDIDFYGLYRVYTDGTVTAETCTNADGDTDGTIRVSGATNAYIVITLGTDYELSSETFTASATSKPTFSTGLEEARAKVEGYMNALDAVSSNMSLEEKFQTLKTRHVADYDELFGRVSLELDFDAADTLLTTDELLENYKNGSGSGYLEALYFQYGRYLLIASSREGALPANLQGTWNRYNHAPWSSGYWHNINVQMNYWPAFSANLAETFKAYVDYNAAYMQQAENASASIIQSYNPDALGADGGNGWSIGTGAWPNDVVGSESLGNLGFTTQLFWEYYAYSGDKTILREIVYPVLVGAARFITKMVKPDADGNYIAIRTDSPEQYVGGVWYYTDKGATYAQSFAYQNNYNMLLAAKELGIDFSDADGEDYEIISTVLEQIDKYSPVVIGLSGQVKEFFEEDYYGDMGEWQHRHISQLVGLYPGNIINETTPAWLDAAKTVLAERGDKGGGWGVAHRMNLWARVKNTERAYDLYENLLKNYTATNLWDMHPPFQIDGNMGGVAGVTEMLLQSHAGYIEPLAAIPAEWADGSYTGLIARGNFEVAAKWSDGLAECFNITSNNCGELSVKYSGIEGSVVRTLDGRVVPYTVKGDSIISFDTVAGETYIISGFEREVKPESVDGLSIESAHLSDSVLTWNKSSDAASYNVYAAKNSEPAYTLLANTRATGYVYKPEELSNDRITFAVTAVDVYGNESDRALVYRNPDDVSAPVIDATASIIDGKLQVAVKSNDYASRFRLYSYETKSKSYTLLTESSYPVIIYDDFDADKKYGVSVLSLFGEESEIAQITPRADVDVNLLDYQPSNILLNTEFDPTPLANGMINTVDYGYGALTDGLFGLHEGRFSTNTASGRIFDATVPLKGSFLLGEMRIFDFGASATACDYIGAALTVELMYNGEWTTVVSLSGNAEILTHRKDSADGKGYISIDLSGYKAQAVRIYIPDSYMSNSISIYEIECSGVNIPSEYVYSNNLISGKLLAVTDASKSALHANSGREEVLTDGILSPTVNSEKWYTWWNQPDMQFDAYIELGDAIVSKLRVYDTLANMYVDYSSTGPRYIIEIYNDGSWKRITDITTYTDNIRQYRDSGKAADGSEQQWLEFDLGGVKAERVRLYMPPRSTGYFDIEEIEIEGYVLDSMRNISYSSNVLLGNEFIPTKEAGALVWRPYKNATDGDKATNFASLGDTSFADATMTFSGVAYLDTLSVDYGNGGDSGRVRSGTGLIIQTFADGEWTDVLDITYAKAYQGVQTFELGHVKAEKLRFCVPGVYKSADATLGLSAGDCIQIYEISCTGSIVQMDKTWSDNLFADYSFEAGPDAGAIWEPNTYDKMTDGGLGDSNRFSTFGDARVDGILDFEGNCVELYTLRVDYCASMPIRCGANLIIEVYRDGEWYPVLNRAHTEGIVYEEIKLGGVKAEKVRLKIDGVFEGGDCIQIYETGCTGFILPKGYSLEDKGSNLLYGVTGVTLENATAQSTHPELDSMFDGNLDTRFAVKDQGETAYSIVVPLGRVASLYNLSIYDFRDSSDTATRSDKTTVEIYSNGIWVPVVTDMPLSFDSDHTEFHLYGVKTDRIRITFKNSKGSLSASIYEIKCTEGLDELVDRSGLLDAYKAIENAELEEVFGLEEMRAERLKEGVAYLMDTVAGQEKINGYTASLNEYLTVIANGAPVTDAYGDFESYNLSLIGNIGFNFYGALTDNITDTFESAFLLVEYADGSREKLFLSDMERESDGRYVARLEFAAAQMTDKLKLRLVFDGSACGEYIEQSIKDYAMNILADPAYEAENPGINRLICAMLNYGAYAQEYFGYRTDALANSEIDSTLEEVTESSATSTAGNATGLKMDSWTLSLESVVGAKVYFKLDAGYDINSYTAKLISPTGETAMLEIEDLGTRYRVIVDEIVSVFLNDRYTVILTNVNDGSAVTLEFSATCYVSRVLSGSSDKALINLAKALRIYSDAADGYFN